MMFITNRKWLIIFSLTATGWVLLIFVESSLPPLKISGEMNELDKVAHFAACSILGIMLLAALSQIDAYKKYRFYCLRLFWFCSPEFLKNFINPLSPKDRSIAGIYGGF
jgi:hypothetical protein